MHNLLTRKWQTYVQMYILRAVKSESLKIRCQHDIIVIGTHVRRQTAKRLFLVARHRSARLTCDFARTVIRSLYPAVSDEIR